MSHQSIPPRITIEQARAALDKAKAEAQVMLNNNDLSQMERTLVRAGRRLKDHEPETIRRVFAQQMGLSH